MKNKKLCLSILLVLMLSLLLCACGGEGFANESIGGRRHETNRETDIVDYYAYVECKSRSHTSGWDLLMPSGYGVKLHDDPGGGLKEIEKAKCELFITNADRYDGDGKFVEHIDELRCEEEITGLELEKWYDITPAESVAGYYGGKNARITTRVTVYYADGSDSTEVFVRPSARIVQ